MSRNLLHSLVFLLGLAAIVWVGAGYATTNPLGAGVALLIAACYLAGARELYRYRQATATLDAALADADAAAADLPGWLARLAPGLRTPVRLRVEGERVALPAPVLAPYLVGLLVLLGMLGTLLGMMATLRGTGLALEGAADLETIRGSLAAPVKGLGFAFGTSIAGVAASAMLGLLAALCRRERLQAVQRLDTLAATRLQLHAPAHQRAQTLQLLRQQGEVMPALVDRLQALMGAIEQQGAAAQERLAASQEQFHARTEAVHARLAEAVEQSLRQGVADSARAVGDALQPLLQATLTGLAGETAALQASVGQAVQAQLDGLAQGFERSAAGAAASWHEALAEQRRLNQAQAESLQAALAQAGNGFEQRATGLADTLGSRLEASSAANAAAWSSALERQQAQAEAVQAALSQAADSFERRATGLAETLATRLDASTAATVAAWDAALARQQDAHAQLATQQQQALDAAAAALETRAGAMAQALGQAQDALQAGLEARDAARLEAWSQAFAAHAEQAGLQWQQGSEQAAAAQRAICDTLARTAEEIGTQAQAQAERTIAEVATLLQAAAEAPRAAAEVVAELREKLSESMVRDTATLEERARLLATVETLLGAVNHASTEQRAAVDALVATSAELLERTGHRFTAQVEAETGKLEGVAAQLAVGAADVASLGEALGGAVEVFGGANAALAERLQQVASALEGAAARSDEQLAYYVAQAREVVDLSVLSQKQIVEELQQLAARGTAGA